MKYRLGVIPFKARLLASALLAAQCANAAILYDTMDETRVDAAWSDTVRGAFSFYTTATDFTLSTITIPVRNHQALTSGTLVFDVYTSDGADGPGVLLNTVGLWPVADVGSAAYENLTMEELDWTLAPDTEYWLVFYGGGLGAGEFSVPTTAGSGPFPTRGYSVSSDGGSSWSTADTGTFGVALITTVPEPHEYGLIGGTALAGFACYRRRLVSKAAR